MRKFSKKHPPRHGSYKTQNAQRAVKVENKRFLPEGRLVVGRNSVRELLKHSPQRLTKIYVGTDKQRVFSAADLDVVNKNKIPLEQVDQEFLNKAAGNESHQSVLACVKDKAPINFKDFLSKQEKKDHSLVLVLDDIQDPQNLGTILRAAECFAADLVVYSKNKGAGITPVVSKASVGASEILDIMQVSNLVDTLRKLKDAGYWIVLADADPKAADLDKFEFPKKTVIVMGSEGAGAQALIKKEADFTLFINLYGQISSLNVSQATTLFLHAFRRLNPEVLVSSGLN